MKKIIFTLLGLLIMTNASAADYEYVRCLGICRLLPCLARARI